MILYILTVRSVSTTLNKSSAKAFPLETPELGSEIVVEVTKDFPHYFYYVPVHNNSFKSKYSVLLYKSLSALFKDVEKREIDVGITLASYYKKKPKLLSPLPAEGIVVYTHKNVEIRAIEPISFANLSS